MCEPLCKSKICKPLSKRKGEPRLRDCIEHVISTYGKNIFKETREPKKYKQLVRGCVNTRNKLFHLDKEKTQFLNGREALIVLIKLSLLYRIVIIKSLGIEDAEIEDRARKCFEALDDQVEMWNLTDEVKNEYADRAKLPVLSLNQFMCKGTTINELRILLDDLLDDPKKNNKNF